VTERVKKVKQDIKNTIWDSVEREEYSCCEEEGKSFGKVRLSLLPGTIDPK